MAWWPVIVMLGLYVAGFLVDLRVLFYFEHPDDSKYNQGLLAKVVTLFGLELTWLLISGLPTDAFGAYNAAVSGLDMYFFWSVGFLFISIFLVVPLPFAVYMYETDSDPRISKVPGWKKGLCMAAIVAAIAGSLVGVSYAVFSTIQAPLNSSHCSELRASYDENGILGDELSTCGTPEKDHIGTKAPFFVYLATFCAFVGYWFFAPFLGVGLVSLPMDLIFQFIDRPMPIDVDKFKVLKRGIGERASSLRSAGQTIKQREIMLRDSSGLSAWRQKMELKADVKRFRQSVYIIEKDFRVLNVALKERGENPFYSYLRLFLGIFSAFLSLVWLVHIIMYACLATFIRTMPGPLNIVLQWIRKTNVFFLDMAVYTFLVVYLLIAVVKGSFKFGMRVFHCFSIHPMRKGDTRLNSILFNVAIILISTCSLMHFSWHCFKDYAHGTALEVIFGSQGQHLTFYRYFFSYSVFPFMIVLFSTTSLVWLCIKPRDSAALSIEELKKRTPVQQNKPPSPRGKEGTTAADETELIG